MRGNQGGRMSTAIAQRISRAVGSSQLGSDDHSIGSIDVIITLAMASKNHLGSLVIRLKYGLDQSCYIPLLALLSAPTNYNRLLSVNFRETIAKQAIREAVRNQCGACDGTAIRKMDNGVVHACTQCGATGIRRYSDAERMRTMGIDQAAAGKYLRMVDRLIDAMCTAEHEVTRGVRDRLAA
jgi:predicted RNA-binding Zn-ribbon protein involved in translation (DUF1610 family)